MKSQFTTMIMTENKGPSIIKGRMTGRLGGQLGHSNLHRESAGLLESAANNTSQSSVSFKPYEPSYRAKSQLSQLYQTTAYPGTGVQFDMMRTKVARDGGSFANHNPTASIKQLIMWEKPNINQAIKPSKRQQLESNFNSKHILKPSIEQVVQSFRRPGGSVLA